MNDSILKVDEGVFRPFSKFGVYIKLLLVVCVSALFIMSVCVSAKENDTSVSAATFAPVELGVPKGDNAASAGTYISTLNQIIKKWATPINGTVSQGRVSQTYNENLSSDSFAKLKFTLDDNRIVRFYVRPKDLYVLGYSVYDPSRPDRPERYFKIKEEGKWNTPNPAGFQDGNIKNLNFEGSYKGLGDESASVRKGINYGWVALSNSLKPLFSALDSDISVPMSSQNESLAKKALLVVVPMFVEAARFKPSIGDKINKNIISGVVSCDQNKGTCPLKSDDMDLMNCWAKLSRLGYLFVDGKTIAGQNVVCNKEYASFNEVSAKVSTFLITQKNDIKMSVMVSDSVIKEE
ncbi:ribosome-inactivating family protein [Pseudomonas chlororaphis subsp. aurantiaca]|uniref:ribosome-inactivating family protein n=1 Tax=Pseudomonas chlororaphis TaxID=587753 RepID=UPI0027DDA37F|nr:ribosome-inactivating family protein [Pseudomonas chlororaphis]WMI97791.1 ribosome-inactivating family protein [Pseudomonas chlororaphis subsp. aurantiaca]